MFTLLAQANDAADQPLQFFGVRFIGVTPDNARRLLITVCFIAAIAILHGLLRLLARVLIRGGIRSERIVFWVRQAVSVVLAIFLLIGLLSIWFNNPTRLATFMGLVTAGVAFALQKPISALAGYLVILRGKTFGVGDRITMGGVRGDVIALRFTQTTIMEMGQPPGVQTDDPAMWVQARQYTGRILPFSYKDDRKRAEKILLDAATQHSVKEGDINERDMQELTRRYFLPSPDIKPRVFMRLTDNWIELTVRFLVGTHGIREVKNAMSRQIIDALDAAKIGIASSTYDVVGMPPLRVQIQPPLESQKNPGKAGG
jgi:small-conductance mechanosensitive channel